MYAEHNVNVSSTCMRPSLYACVAYKAVRDSLIFDYHNNNNSIYNYLFDQSVCCSDTVQHVLLRRNGNNKNEVCR